jgi:hypothetical protein
MGLLWLPKKKYFFKVMSKIIRGKKKFKAFIRKKILK